MAARPKAGIRQYIMANIWVIVVDAAGALLLLSLLATAAGSPALAEWMFVLLTAVPIIAALTIVTPRRKNPGPARISPARPGLERKIIISPRPSDKRVDQMP